MEQPGLEQAPVWESAAAGAAEPAMPQGHGTSPVIPLSPVLYFLVTFGLCEDGESCSTCVWNQVCKHECVWRLRTAKTFKQEAAAFAFTTSCAWSLALAGFGLTLAVHRSELHPLTRQVKASQLTTLECRGPVCPSQTLGECQAFARL